MMTTNKPGLYIHIPFCSSICSYCGFIKLFYESSLANKYLKKLEEELTKYSSFSFDSIYIGGGTPTSLSVDQLEYLFKMIQPYLNENSTICIESNPDISEEKIRVLKKYNVSRISIGIQTFNKKYLSIINRNSSFEFVKRLIELLRKYDINDINVDLIYGFNSQTIEELDEDLDLFLSLDINHISTYALQIEEMTILYNKKYETCDDENANKLYHRIVTRLKEKEIYRYEVSNFSKKGYESKHNLIYWINDEYGGVGLHASSYISRVRRTNTKSFTKYLRGEYQDYEEILSKEDEEFYFIMLGLRKENGISLSEYAKRYNKNFLDVYKEKIDSLKKNELIEINDYVLKIKEENFFIMDYILRKLLY